MGGRVGRLTLAFYSTAQIHFSYSNYISKSAALPDNFVVRSHIFM